MNQDKIINAAIGWHRLVELKITRASLSAFVMGAQLGHNHDCWQTYADLTKEQQEEVDALKKRLEIKPKSTERSLGGRSGNDIIGGMLS